MPVSQDPSRTPSEADLERPSFPWLWTLLAGGVFLLVFTLAYSRIPGEFYEVRDDGVITLSHARNWVEYGVIGVSPSGDRVEGFSAPVQFFLYAAAYWLTRLDYRAFALAQTLVFTFLLGAVYFQFFRDRPRCGLVLTSASALCLTQFPSFLLWHGSGLENPITHFFFLISVYLLLVSVREGRVRWLLTIPVLCASLSRIDGIYHVAPVLLIYAISWSRMHRSWRGPAFVGLILVLWTAFQVWRVSYFGDLLPNTAYAQVISVANRVRRVIELNPVQMDRSLGLAKAIFSDHGGYLIIIFAPMLLLFRHLGGRSFVFLVLASLAVTAFLNPFVFGKTSLDPTRSTTQLTLVSVLFAALAIGQVERTRLARFGISLLLAIGVLVHLPRRVDPYPLCCDTEPFDAVRREFASLADSEQLPRPLVANPDLGVLSWHKQFNVLDLGMLGNRFTAHLRHGPALANYILDYAAPDLIECHGSWSHRYRETLFADPRFEERYLPVHVESTAWREFRVPSGVWIRKDVRRQSTSPERMLIDEIARDPSVERLARELDLCADSGDCGYVARTAFRFLPELRQLGHEDALIELFEHRVTAPIDLHFLAGAGDGNRFEPAAQYLIDEVLDSKLGAGPTRRPPIIENVFDVHYTGSELIFVKEPCSQRDVEWRFRVSLQVSDGPGSTTSQLGFNFKEHGYLIGDRGVAFFRLPDVEILAVRTGQVTWDGETHWVGESIITRGEGQGGVLGGGNR